MRRSEKGILAGMSEAADLLDVSSSRVDQLIKTDPAFPEPIDTIAASRVWRVSDLVAYAAIRNTKRGRKFREGA